MESIQAQRATHRARGRAWVVTALAITALLGACSSTSAQSVVADAGMASPRKTFLCVPDSTPPALYVNDCQDCPEVAGGSGPTFPYWFCDSQGRVAQPKCDAAYRMSAGESDCPCNTAADCPGAHQVCASGYGGEPTPRCETCAFSYFGGPHADGFACKGGGVCTKGVCG